MKKPGFFLSAAVILIISNTAFADVFNPLGTENCVLALDRQTGFIVMSGSALVSYLISEFLSGVPHLDYYQFHGGYYYGESGGGGPAFPGEPVYTPDNYHVIMQNFGVEREFSPWFSLMLEANLQEMANANYFSMGIGLKPYVRWTFFRKWRIHPYIEYGAGIFYAFSEFPENGSKLTFNLNYALGLEYILPNKDKIRLDFNFKHHSNNNLFESNPGFDGNGVSISFCRYWKEREKKFNRFWNRREG